MKEHNGMRPHDILILLQIVCLEGQNWYGKDIAYSLKISASEVSKSLQRSKIAKLIGGDKNKVNRLALIDFLIYGLPYVYPQEPSMLTRGVPTAHSGPPLNKHFNSRIDYVWPYARGETQGLSVEPLHKNVPKIIHENSSLYEMLVLVDAVRVGKAREKKIAIDLLKEKISGHA